MAIKEGDVVLLKSLVMADVPEGGGGPSAAEIKDGRSNDMFADVSDANRLLGNVTLRQVAVAVQTDDTDSIMGLHVTATQPQDPGVSVTLFADGGHFTQRAEAVNRKLAKNSGSQDEADAAEKTPRQVQGAGY